MLTFFLQDVTTRGSYYPDKNMATAAVSDGRQVILLSRYLTLYLEPPSLPPCHQHHEGGS